MNRTKWGLAALCLVALTALWACESPTVADTSVVPTSVTLSSTTLSLATGATSTLTATVLPTKAADKSVTWESSNTAIATVSAAGLVTAVAAGDATITVTTVKSAKTATCTVTVADIAVTSVTLDTTSVSLVPAATQQLTATVTPSDATNKTVTWSSNAEAVATVDSTGLVTAVSGGTATITATAGAYSATCTVTVKALALDLMNLTLVPGSSYTLTATTSPSGGTVTWTSADSTIAGVSSGTITAVAKGSTTVTATYNGSSIDVTVKVLDLLSQYGFESVSSGVLAASAGSVATNMTLPVGTATTENTLVTGKVGSYGMLSGTTNTSTQGGIIAAGLYPSTSTSFTVSAWIDASADWSSFLNIGGVMVDLPNIFAGAGTAFTVDTWAGPWYTSAVYSNNCAYYSLYGTTSTANDLGWVHLTITVDPATGITYYKNGLAMLNYPVSDTTFSTLTTYLIAQSKVSDILVCRTFGDNPVAVDDLRFYNGTLTAEGVYALHAVY